MRAGVRWLVSPSCTTRLSKHTQTPQLPGDSGSYRLSKVYHNSNDNLPTLSLFISRAVFFLRRVSYAVSDRRPQFVIMRDPRAQALSTFYHEKVHSRSKHAKTVGNGEHTLGEFMLSVLPHLCHWMTIRYFLFAGTLAEQSTFLWYEDAMVNTSEWHFDWLASAGLHLPQPVLEHMAEGALHQEFQFMRQGLNEHPGQEDQSVRREGQPLNPRSWKSEISPDLMEKMDAIMRQWLPPVIRSKIYDLP